jgi:hypothetical protein
VRCAFALLVLLLTTSLSPTPAAADTVDDTLTTNEVMAFGLNTYLVFLEISELTAQRPRLLLAAAGALTGAATLVAKDYDGSLFSAFLTGMAAADLLLGSVLIVQNRRLRVTLAPTLQPAPGGGWGRAGLQLTVRF